MMQDQLDACQQSFGAQLAIRGIDPSLVDTCGLGGPYFLTPQACYNYTFYNSVPFPKPYLDELDTVCGANCTLNCTQNLIAMATTLGPTNTNFACVVYIMVEYMTEQRSLSVATDRLNCYIVLPPPLVLGVNQTALDLLDPSPQGSTLGIGPIIGIAVAGFLVVLLIVLAGVCLHKRRKNQSPEWSIYRMDSQRAISRTMPVGTPDRGSAGQIILYTYNELRKATNDFAQTRLLGRGGSGCVFLGDLPRSGGLVAVKKIMKGMSKSGSKVRL
jgi:hypothetical protein